MSKWFQLPIFDFGWGEVSNIINKLMEQYDNLLPLTVLKEQLEKTGMRSQYLAKLTGSKLIVIENDLVKPGADLNQLKSLLSVDANSPISLSTWRKWAAARIYFGNKRPIRIVI